MFESLLFLFNGNLNKSVTFCDRVMHAFESNVFINVLKAFISVSVFKLAFNSTADFNKIFWVGHVMCFFGCKSFKKWVWLEKSEHIWNLVLGDIVSLEELGEQSFNLSDFNFINCLSWIWILFWSNTLTNFKNSFVSIFLRYFVNGGFDVVCRCYCAVRK